MRSLFLRIFLWLWLAMAVVAAVLVITSPFFTRSRPGLENWHRDAEEWARGRVDRVAIHLEETGVGAGSMGRGHGQGRRGRGGPPPAPAKVFVVDEGGGELNDQIPPPEALEIARRALESDEEISERTGTLYLFARPVTDPEGRRVAVVAAHQSPPRLVHLLEPKALALRLGVLVLVVGALSFWLARYLSSPVGPLRRATRRLSGGDLGARVEGRVTGRRDEIGELARDFDAMAERVERLVDSQQQLLRDVSHELRSPLARLGVALELARARAGDTAAKPLDRIELEAARLDELIAELLLLQRLEGGEIEEEVSEVDLGELISGVVDDAAFEASARDCGVRFESGDPIVVRVRPRLLRSALDNVIRNAVHHTVAGSVVDVECHGDDHACEITIRDRGPGVDDDHLELIFEPFHRVEAARDRATGGAGLGLAIAAGAVRAHGGAIAAANHPNGGLVVTVLLPEEIVVPTV